MGAQALIRPHYGDSITVTGYLIPIFDPQRLPAHASPNAGKLGAKLGIQEAVAEFPRNGEKWMSLRGRDVGNCGPQCVSLLVMSWISLSMGAGDALKGPLYGSLSSVIV